MPLKTGNNFFFNFNFRSEILEDVKLIHSNSVLFNGEESDLSKSSKKLFELFESKVRSQANILDKIDSCLARAREEKERRIGKKRRRNESGSDEEELVSNFVEGIFTEKVQIKMSSTVNKIKM